LCTDEGVDGLVRERCERRDVDQRRDLRMGAGLGDDGAAIGMADEPEYNVGLGEC
jgi:hypothetical protein